MNKKYFKCAETDNVWSYRENTSEQLIITLVDEEEKCFVFPNSDYADTLLQMELGLELAKQGYVWTLTETLSKFLGEKI